MGLRSHDRLAQGRALTRDDDRTRGHPRSEVLWAGKGSRAAGGGWARWTMLVWTAAPLACALSVGPGSVATRDGSANAPPDAVLGATGIDVAPDLGASPAREDVAPGCAPPREVCAGACVELSSSVDHCGRCGNACGPSLRCLAGVCAGGPPPWPRPIAPLSLGDVTQRRPTLRLELPQGYDRAEVQLCRDRACTTVVATLSVVGSSARPPADLPASSVVFWRARARAAGKADSAYGPTWMFHVPARSASAGVDTSMNPHLDVNGDGFDDVIVGAPAAVPSGGTDPGTASVFLGGPSGITAAPQRILAGVVHGGRFGYSVANAGDVNGDGFADLVVGASGATSGGQPEVGSASVFLGGANGVSGTPQRVLEGSAAMSRFGNTVASAGDVNGDGYADLVVGAFSANAVGRSYAGAVSVFLGSVDGIPDAPLRVLEGMETFDGFGWSVAGAGDVDGDGYSDIVVGAKFANRGGRTYTGTVSVFHGSATGIAATPRRVLEGRERGDDFGWSVASAGDINGDGYSDIVVGALQEASSHWMLGGFASVFLGSATGVAAAPQRVLERPMRIDNFGHSVSIAGDVNGDGYADLVVGAPFIVGSYSDRGIVSVYLGGEAGAPAAPHRVLEGPRTDDFGWSVTGAGDVNGDGYADLVVGAPSAVVGDRGPIGTASLFVGGASRINATPQRVLTAPEGTEDFGWSVASTRNAHQQRVDAWYCTVFAGPTGSTCRPPLRVDVPYFVRAAAGSRHPRRDRVVASSELPRLGV